MFSICFAASHHKGSTHPKQLAAPPSSFPGNHIQHLFEPCLWVSVLYLDLFCETVSKTCPKIIASSFYANLVCKSFHRRALLSDSGGHLYRRNSDKKKLSHRELHPLTRTHSLVLNLTPYLFAPGPTIKSKFLEINTNSEKKILRTFFVLIIVLTTLYGMRNGFQNSFQWTSPSGINDHV